MSFLHLRSALVTGLLSLLCAASALAQSTMVRVHTTQGPMDLKLLDTQAPITVANFLAYVRGGDWQGMFFHRSAKVVPSGAPFVVQGGGFRWPEGASCCPTVNNRGQIRNEYDATRSNIRGTVAMAKLSSGPNTASNQWFINLGDNASNLDSQNGGFTVFARVTTPGMAVADRIAALPTVNAGSPFNELPVSNYISGTAVQRSNLVLTTHVTEFPALAAQTESDRIFNYLEAAYPQHLVPSNGEAGTWEGYTYRYYSGSKAYVGTKDGKVWYLVPSLGGDITALEGSQSDWLATATAAGY